MLAGGVLPGFGHACPHLTGGGAAVRGVCSYVSNKAGLTGQTVPGRRIPGHWPYLGPDELAETEPVCPDGETFLSFTPPPSPHERVRWPSSAGMAAPRPTL